MIPFVDAKRVLEDREMVFNKTHPAIILVHDFGASRQQMLPLVRPLHEAGYFVLVLGLRGNVPDSRFGSTFGLNEANDVKAAAALLRKTPFVDGKRVGVLGVGTGATAALLAGNRDPEIAALVLDCPSRTFEHVLREHLTPSHPYLQWLAPLCQWTFEIAYKVNATDVDLEHNVSRLNSNAVLLFDGKSVSCFRAARVQQVIAFLDANLKPKETETKEK
jgi:pimeloyl-ACP methyl ester carboxylesterase